MTSKNGEMTSQDSKYGAIEFNFFVYKKVITNNVWDTAVLGSLWPYKWRLVLPIKDPHCEAGTTSLKEIGGRGTVPGDNKEFRS